MNSRLSIIAAVSVRWLSIEPARGRQAEPVAASKQLGGMVAAELEGVAALDQADALGGQAFELDGADLGAVLLELAAALGLLVGVELAFDALDLAVEQVDERPEQVVEIVLEPGVGRACARRRRRSRRAGRATVSASGSGRGSGSSWPGR